MEYVKTLTRTYTSGINEDYVVFKSVNNFNIGYNYIKNPWRRGSCEKYR